VSSVSRRCNPYARVRQHIFRFYTSESRGYDDDVTAAAATASSAPVAHSLLTVFLEHYLHLVTATLLLLAAQCTDNASHVTVISAS